MNQKSPQDQPQPGPSSGNILSLTPTTLIVTESIASEIASDPSTSTDAINYTRATTRTKLKRNRLVLSCIPCHKRKQQCDRGQPCERCVKRGIEQQCHYGSAKKPKSTINEIDNNSPQDRVAQLEDMVQATLGNMDPAALVGIDSLLQLVHASNAIASPAAHLTGPGIADPVRVTEHAVLVATAALGQLSRPGANNHSRPFNGPIAEILSHIRYTNAAQFYSTPTSLSDLQTYFPDHSITTRMLTYFFETSSIPWLWSIIHRPTFDSCFIAFSSSRQSPALDFIALLAMICAVALQFFPASLEDATIFASYPPGRNVLQNRLYEFSRSILTTCINSSYVTLERIQALILLSLYNENEGKLTESYNATGAAVRMAQFLGMNRDGFTVWHMRPYDAELRRRLWWQIFALDRYQSLTLRRPYMIHEKHCDVVTPLNLDSTELCDVLDLQGKPLDQPTEHMYHILQIQWTTLLGRMWDQCFCAVVPSYRMILDIEDQIRRFELDIPACFRLQSVQAAHAKPYLLFQRPFFFRRPATDISNLPIDENKVAILTQYAQVVCITFCKRSLALLQLIITQNVNRGQLRWPMFTLSAFEPVLMLTVAILMDPRNSQNEELEEWITLGVAVLRELGQIDPMALNAVAGLHVVQKRVRLVVQAQGAGDTASDVPHIADINQNLDRATQTLAQIQPTIVDMIGVAESNDPFLVQHQIPEFLGNFPGVEFLCSQNDPQALESFLDTWITR